MPTILFPPPENKDIYCNDCKRETIHEFKGGSLREYHNQDEDNWQPITDEAIAYRLYICGGCGRGTLEEIYANDFGYHDTGEFSYYYDYYPPREELFLQKKNFQTIPLKLQTIYTETIQAYNNGTPILCAVGIRSLVEGICADKGIRGRTLEDKINRLVFYLQEGYVQKLHSLRFLGNDAAHELETPQHDELMLAIEICEKLLDYLYELDYKASQLTEIRGKRKNGE